jgi:cell division protein ZapA
MNQKFSLKSEADEKHVQKVADYVNRKIFEIQEKTRSVSSLNVALLAALNIADDYFKTQGSKVGKNTEAKSKIKEIINLIDRSLEEV